jgi:endonuclease/exonuclease/phosphatase family metal-dependent hydrolase
MGWRRTGWRGSIGGVGLLAIVLGMGGNAPAEPLRVMSFNIRYGSADDGENAWPKRRKLLFEMLRDEAPQVIGMQEAERFQLDELAKALPDFGEVGVGRDDGKAAGEYSPILYDKRRVELLDQGTFWFAEEPSKPGAIAWGAHLPRVCSWILARDKVTGREFYFFNMHWDHESQNARQRSADLLLERIAERAQSDVPVVVTGDFNADEANPAFVRLVSSKRHGLTDTFRRVHPDETAVQSFHGFRGGSDQGGKIDAVLVSPEWEVQDAEIVRTHRDKLYPSDHYPVTAIVKLPAEKND